MMGNYRLKHLLSLLVVLIFVGCVGTVEDTAVQDRELASAEVEFLSYEGVSDAQGISDSKIEVYFPASAQTGIQYLIYVNESTTPIRLNEESLQLAPSGDFVYTLEDLNISTQYRLRVEIHQKDEDTDIYSRSETYVDASTVSNVTARFRGVSSLEIPAGTLGKSSIIINWTPAESFGSISNLKEYDPIGYEITYISEVGGLANLNNANYTGDDRRVLQLPGSFPANPSLSSESSYQIYGLIEGTAYYVQVRAINYGYHLYADDDPNYKYEQNTKYLSVTTAVSGGMFDFDPDSVALSSPPGSSALQSIDVVWKKPTGDFSHYRIYKKLIADANDPGFFTEEVIDTQYDNGAASYERVGANESTHSVGSLTAYSLYEIAFAVCRTEACESNNRVIVMGDSRRQRTDPTIAPFSGITNIAGPIDTSAAELERVYLGFQPPVINSGYITSMELYCYREDMSDPLLIVPSSASFTGTDTGNPCYGLRRVTGDPASFNGYSSFDEIEIENTVLDQKYCFSLVPVIDTAGFTYREIGSSLIACHVPRVTPPTLEQFGGKNAGCDLDKRTLSVSWDEPTGGMYTDFIVFWKEKNAIAFSFSDAMAAFEGIDNSASYSWVNPAIGTTDYDIEDLMPSKEYHVGVLTHIQSSGDHFYSELNSETSSCLVPLPAASFVEWHDIMAIGPKENGLWVPTTTTPKNHLLETLDDYGLPVEVEINPANDVPTGDSVSRLGSATFNGIYGARDADSEEVKHQYSNSGIVRIAWEDVNFWAETVTLTDFAEEFDVGAAKSARKFGYKVFRSDDNKASWVDLTSSDHDFQATSNAGYLLADTFTWRKLSNGTPIDSEVVVFTDYSVQYAPANGQTDRARVYWYKVVPYFNDQPIAFSDSGHNVIEVTLPPPNMALVHRVMANRHVCYELGTETEDLDKSSSGYYSCSYDGVGSSTLGFPWTLGQSVYDIGGDLLVDRFEMGCHFTRGSISNQSNSTYGDEAGELVENFIGKSSGGSDFEGCMGGALDGGSGLQTLPLDDSKVLRGDCIGQNYSLISADATACAWPVVTGDDPNFVYVMVPGLGGPINGDTVNCSLPFSLFSNFEWDKKLAQSEMAAVYTFRGPIIASDHRFPEYESPAGKLETTGWSSNCMINLPYQTTPTTGRYYSRWLYATSLFGALTAGGSSVGDLYDKTISQVAANGNLYGNDGDVTTYYAPARLERYYDKDETVVARIFSSPAAKLPPLRGFNQDQAAEICSTYSVETGHYSEGNWYEEESAQSKRLMRRKEFVATAAYPMHDDYDEDLVTDLEEGDLSSKALSDSLALNRSCNGSSRSETYNDSNLDVGENIRPYSYVRASAQKLFYMTGSSRLDHLDSTEANTEQCTSRYGVQDLAGNLMEYGSDQFLCNFNEDLFIGPTVGTAVTSITMEQAMVHPLINDETFPYKDGLHVWALDYSDSGQCSPVEEGSPRGYVQQSGGLVSAIYESFNVINPDVVPNQNLLDTESVLDLRNGDGWFLDFGQERMMDSITKPNSWSLKTEDNEISRFFNPALGLTLSCEGVDVCNQSQDNMKYTTEHLVDLLALTPADFVNATFPTHNSELETIGTSDVVITTHVGWPNEAFTPVTYIDDINPGSISATVETSSLTNDVDVTLSYFHHWSVSRGGKYVFHNGGSYNSDAGRYSLMGGNPVGTNSAVRCVVKINKRNF